MADSARIDTRLPEPEGRREPFWNGNPGEPRGEAARTRSGRPLLRRILGPDGVVRTRLARSVVLDAIRASSGR